MQERKRLYGCLPDLPDQRDFLHVPAVSRLSALPKDVDLGPGMPPVYDQGQLGSCTGNASAGAAEYRMLREGLADFTPSRLAIYYGERQIEGTVKSDSGAMIRDAMKVLAKTGAASETLWPYDVTKFAQSPPPDYYAAAHRHLCTAYERVPQSELAIKGALAAGLPIVFGISVYASFESAAVAKTGTVPMPKPHEAMLGGHAILMTGYTAAGLVRFRNSWGSSWGAKGYGTLPLAYVLNSDLCSDLWVLKTLT